MERKKPNPDRRKSSRSEGRGSAEGRALPASRRLLLLSVCAVTEKVSRLQRVSGCFLFSETCVPQGSVCSLLKARLPGSASLLARDLSAFPFFLSLANYPQRGSSALSILKKVSVQILAEVV